MKYLLKIKDLNVPINIKEYKTAKTMKMFFKDEVLIVTKSPYVRKYDLDMFLMMNEPYIYEEYKKILESKSKKIKSIWKNGEKILYEGIEYEVEIIYHKKDIISVRLEKDRKKFLIILPQIIKEEEIDENVKRAIKQLFKNNTEAMLYEKLPYWSKITKIKYNSFNVRDAKSKYGSCIPKTKDLHFSSRLIMLKEEAVDAVIVHELCHIIHPNHSQEFYNLVEKYIPNYFELDKYLKNVSKEIRKF